MQECPTEIFDSDECTDEKGIHELDLSVNLRLLQGSKKSFWNPDQSSIMIFI